jgi:hypothetical protein
MAVGGYTQSNSSNSNLFPEVMTRPALSKSSRGCSFIEADLVGWAEEPRQARMRNWRPVYHALRGTDIQKPCRVFPPTLLSDAGC